MGVTDSGMAGVDALDQLVIGWLVAVVHPDLIAVTGEEGQSQYRTLVRKSSGRGRTSRPCRFGLAHDVGDRHAICGLDSMGQVELQPSRTARGQRRDDDLVERSVVSKRIVDCVHRTVIPDPAVGVRAQFPKPIERRAEPPERHAVCLSLDPRRPLVDRRRGNEDVEPTRPGAKSGLYGVDEV